MKQDRQPRQLGIAPSAPGRSVRGGAVCQRDRADRADAAPVRHPRQRAQNPDISQTGLVEQTGVDRSTLADIVRRLVKKGLLQRKRTRRDARMYAVRLTAKGKSALGSVRPIAAKVDQRILSVLRTDQRGDFIEALGEIVKAMSRRVAQG